MALAVSLVMTHSVMTLRQPRQAKQLSQLSSYKANMSSDLMKTMEHLKLAAKSVGTQ